VGRMGSAFVASDQGGRGAPALMLSPSVLSPGSDRYAVLDQRSLVASAGLPRNGPTSALAGADIGTIYPRTQQVHIGPTAPGADALANSAGDWLPAVRLMRELADHAENRHEPARPTHVNRSLETRHTSCTPASDDTNGVRTPHEHLDAVG
jgi:hypothetical protein